MRLEIGKNCPRSSTRLATIAQVRQAPSRDDAVGRDLDDPKTLVRALMDAEYYWPGGGEEAFCDDTQLYVRCKATPQAWMYERRCLRNEWVHRSPFFGDRARVLIDRLFEGAGVVDNPGSGLAAHSGVVSPRT